MNLPNKLTLLRVFMIPFFVVFMLTDLGGSYGKYIALAIFIAASLTDMLDGKIAGRSFGTPQAQAVSEEYARMPRQYLHGQLFFLKVRRWGFI